MDRWKKGMERCAKMDRRPRLVCQNIKQHLEQCTHTQVYNTPTNLLIAIAFFLYLSLYVYIRIDIFVNTFCFRLTFYIHDELWWFYHYASHGARARK